MAVGKIEYKEILKDKNLTPTKLKDLYVSSLKNDDSFGGYNKNFATDPAERYTIMTPESAAALIASRQQTKESSKKDTEESEPVEEIAEEIVIDRPQYEPIQGGIWPMTIDEAQVVSIQQPVQSQTTRASNSTQTSGSKQNTSKSVRTNFKDQSDFIQQMTNAYAAELQRRGYDPAFAEYLVTQDALESSWGKSQSGSNNFGGIKGKGTSKQTKEWDGSKMISVTDSFRDFNDLKDYINYKIDLVGNTRYNVFDYSPEEYFERIKAGGYATDPNYVSKLNSVLQTVRKYS